MLILQIIKLGINKQSNTHPEEKKIRILMQPVSLVFVISSSFLSLPLPLPLLFSFIALPKT